jgi:hypothetical protein
MSTKTNSTTILKTVANSLVVKHRYANLEDAYRGMALTAIREKINYYRRRIRRFQRKYASDFETFTTRLEGRASPAEEDDWLAWRSARTMLADWQESYQEILNERAHQ